MLNRFINACFERGRLRRALISVALLSVFAPAVAAPTANLSDSPILAAGRGPASNLLLSLSVEWPTVGAAYKTATYDNNVRTIGYWDADTCYSYVSTGAPAALAAGVPAAGAPAGFFRRSGAANNFQCSGSYSGNFLNWAAQSAIDSLRYAMTGGDRIVDIATQTILQRADLPTDFYNAGSQSYPAKRLDNASSYTPFSGTIFVANCRYVMYIGTQATGTCAAPGNNANRGTFRAAVEVCDATEGPLRGDLCRRQISGSYKPTGVMQQYAEKIRFAAFGYALDSGNAQRYGGVLRAPMKYVGPTQFDAQFQRISNPATEWDANTGVFSINPDGAPNALGNSGVANYLNKFGRLSFSTTAITAGLTSGSSYKSYDPVSELYYEAIRYVQGQQPTAAATSGLTTAMYDSFPIYTNWVDPITSSCQDTSIVQIADANTWNDKTIPGNTRTDGAGDAARSVGSNEPSAVLWTDRVGTLENFTGGGASLGQATTGRGNSFYIAGLAHWAHTQQMRNDRPNIRVKTYMIDVNENNPGYRVKRTEPLYLAAKYGGFDVQAGDATFSPFTPFPDGITPTNTRWANGVDDDQLPLPKTFYLASDPKRMIDGLRKIAADVAGSTGTLAGGSVSSTRIASGSSTGTYTTRLDGQNDAATVLAYKLTYNAVSGAVTVDSNIDWNASTKLLARTSARNMYSTDPAGAGIDFSWSSLDVAQKLLYNTDPGSQLVDNLGQRRVDYLKGARVDENSRGTAGNPRPFRDRTSLIASIVNSAPTYVGAKKPPNGTGGSRSAAVYVGTNNGLLHAFDAINGDELFAFIPQPFVNVLPETTSPNFARKPMVDAPPAVADAQTATGVWKSVLVSGYGGGAQGVFALDVTDPVAFNASKVLWHFSDTDDSKMGNLTSAPQIFKFKVGTNSYKWFAVVPSGYNNNVVDSPINTPLKYDADNTRALFLLALDKPTATAWSLGTNYFRIELPTGFTDTSLTTALGSPGAELGSNGEVVRMYSGDTQGNLWKFDFTLVNNPFASNTSIQGVIGFGGGGNAKPLFTALNGTVRQPITIVPNVGTGPGRSNVIVFGTGKFIEGADSAAASNTQQAIYGIWDDLTNVAASRVTGSAQLALRSASGTGNTFVVEGNEFQYGYDSSGNTSSTKKKGWKFNLPDAANGERQVTNMTVANNFVFFNTSQSVPPAAGACTAFGGRLCSVNGSTGLSNGATCQATKEGFVPSPFVLTADQADTQSPTTGQGVSIRTSSPVIVTLIGSAAGSLTTGVTPKITEVKGKPRTQTRRLSWREIVDYDKMKNVTP